MTEPLKKEIIKRKAQIQQEKERLGDRYNDYGLLFCLENGNPIEPKLMEKWFKKWQAEYGTNYPELEFHGIRHSGSTHKLELSEVDYKSVQGDTGPAKADVLLNTYGHIQDKRRQKLSQKFEDDFYHQQPKTAIEGNNEQLFNLLWRRHRIPLTSGASP